MFTKVSISNLAGMAEREKVSAKAKIDFKNMVTPKKNKELMREKEV